MENTQKTDGKTSQPGEGIKETRDADGNFIGFVCKQCKKHYLTHGYANDMESCYECHCENVWGKPKQSCECNVVELKETIPDRENNTITEIYDCEHCNKTTKYVYKLVEVQDGN